jgi:hypothetical protein
LFTFKQLQTLIRTAIFFVQIIQAILMLVDHSFALITNKRNEQVLIADKHDDYYVEKA